MFILDYLTELKSDWRRAVAGALVFLFPIVVATTNGGGSIVYTLLLLLGFWLGRGWRGLDGWEKALMLGFVLVVAVNALSLVNSADLREGWRWVERYLRIALMIPLYLMLRRYGWALGRELVAGAMLATVVMMGQGWYQVAIGNQDRASGFYHWIVFGDLVVLWGAIALVYWLTAAKTRWNTLATAAALAAAGYASLLTMTRGAWLFLPVFLGLLLVLYGKTLWADRRVAVALLVAVLAGGWLAWQSERVQRGIGEGMHDIEVFMQQPEAATSWGIRLNLWRNSLLLAAEHPLLGTGLGDFHADMKRMAADGTSWSPGVADYGHAHSIYFHSLATSGLLGLVAMVAAYLVLPFVYFYRHWRVAEPGWGRFYALGGLVAVTAFAVFGVSEALWARNPFVNSYVVTMAVLMAGNNVKR